MEVEKLILQRLDKLEDKMDLTREDIAGLKVRAGIWGFMAGLIPPLIGLTMWALSTVH